MPHILIVEDEAAIADTLVYALQTEGHSTEWVTLGSAAVERQRVQPADLIILDIGLPDITGFETCRQLRRFTEVPVMFLTARNDEIDRVVGLEIGADDYVVKPFSPREVTARVRAILKRMAPQMAVAGPAATSAEVSARPSVLNAESAYPPSAPAHTPLHIDLLRMQIRYHGQPLTLTRHEFRLLQCLLEQPQRVFSREQLLDALGVSADAGYERSVDSHIKSLRAKLRQVSETGEAIQTHRGLGYSYNPEQA